MADKVFRPTFMQGQTKFERAEQLAAEIKDAVYRHSGHLSVASAIDIIEIVRREILNEPEK
jgi:hypothetical protein